MRRQIIPSLLAACVLLVAACGDDGDAPGSSAAGDGAEASEDASPRDAIEAYFIGEGLPQEAAACIADGATEDFDDADLAAIGITGAGHDLDVFIPASLDLEPATVAYWDALYDCVPQATDPSTTFGDELTPDEAACVQETIIEDDLLRLALVIGTISDSDIPPVRDLSDQYDAAVRACGIAG